MKRARGGWPVAFGVAAALGLGATALGEGCSAASTSCDCADPQITITVPADIASSISAASIQLGGAACSGVTPTCTNQTNGCTAYAFNASAAGQCDITVDSDGTTFQDSLTVVAATGCCAGFYPATPASAQVQIPEPGDAG